MKIEVGKLAPVFTLPSDEGTTISLADLKGKNVVLYFYPKDDTPGCTIEAQDFTRKIKDFAELDTVVLGVSKDSVKSHCKFIEKYNGVIWGEEIEWFDTLDEFINKELSKILMDECNSRYGFLVSMLLKENSKNYIRFGEFRSDY